MDFLVLPLLMEEAELFYGDLLTKKKKKQEDKLMMKPKAVAPGNVIDKSVIINTAGGSWIRAGLPLKNRKRKPEEKLKAKQPW